VGAQLTHAAGATARALFSTLGLHVFHTAYDLLTADGQAEWARRGNGTARQRDAQCAGSLGREYDDIPRYVVGPVQMNGTCALTLVLARSSGGGRLSPGES
jgi:hypothetical protein